MRDDWIVVDEIERENTHTLSLCKIGNARDGFRYIFVAGLAPNDADESEAWSEKVFETKDEAADWIRTTKLKRARRKRVKYEFPVTVIDHGGDIYRAARYRAGILKGVNASDGSWRVKVGDRTEMFPADSIHTMMPVDDMKRATKLHADIRESNMRLRAIQQKYDLRLPRSGNGRMTVDKAVDADEAMAKLFKQGDDE